MHIINKVDFFERFPNEEFQKVVSTLNLSKDGPWLAGGAIRKCIANQPFDSDWDFFFKDEEQLKLFESKLIIVDKKENTNNNVIFVKKDLSIDIIKDNIYKFQLIKIYHSDIITLLDTFDFTLCQCGFDGEKFYLSDFAMKDILEKKLVVHKITYPVASFRRSFKYVKQGFYMCQGSITEFLKQVKQEDIDKEPKYID